MIYIVVYACTHVHVIYRYMYMYMYIHVHVCIHVHMYVHVCIHEYTCIESILYVYVYIWVLILVVLLSVWEYMWSSSQCLICHNLPSKCLVYTVSCRSCVLSGCVLCPIGQMCVLYVIGCVVFCGLFVCYNCI